MSFCSQITDAFGHLTGIRTLNVSHCSQITDNMFRHLAGIHTLCINHCKHITYQTFSHLTGIHTLYMNGCDQEGIIVFEGYRHPQLVSK